MLSIKVSIMHYYPHPLIIIKIKFKKRVVKFFMQCLNPAGLPNIINPKLTLCYKLIGVI